MSTSLIDSTKRILQKHKLTLLEHGLATCAAAVSRFSMFLIILINTHFLPAAEFGLFTVLLLICNIITAFISCGTDMWLNRFTRYTHTINKKAPIVARYYLGISLGLASLVLGAAIVIAIFFQQSFHNQGLAIACCLFWAASSGLMETLLAILRAQSEIKIFFLIRDFLNPLLLMACIFLLQIHEVSKFFAVAAMIWTSTLLVLFYHVLKNKNSYIPSSPLINWRNTGKGLMAYTFKLIINNFLARLNNGFDTLLLAKLIPMGIVGKYRLCSQISNAFIIIQHFVFLALPWHMRANLSSAQTGIKAIKIRQIILISTTLLALIFLLICGNFLLIYLGQEYLMLAKPLSAFLLIRFSELLWGPQHEILISNNKIFSDTCANLFGLLIGITTFFTASLYYDYIVSGVISAGLSSLSAQFYRFLAIQYVDRLKNMVTSRKYLPWLPLMITFSGMTYVFIK